MLLVDRMPGEFYRFCDSIPGAEQIDSLPPPPPGKKKADYLFANRTIVCEIKSLETETSDKLIPILQKAGVPLQPGEFELTQLLAGRPDSDMLYKKCISAITSALEDAMDSANGQIRDTKKTLDIPHADGLWILLNAKVRVLNPDVAINVFRYRLRKRAASGGPFYDQITQFVLFSEIHKLLILPQGLSFAASIPVQNSEVPERCGVSSFVHEMIEGWAKWNGRSMHTIPASELGIK